MKRDAIHEEYLPDHNLDESQMLHFSKVLVRESGAISSSSAFFSRLGVSPNLSSYFLGMSKFAGLSYPDLSSPTIFKPVGFCKFQMISSSIVHWQSKKLQ